MDTYEKKYKEALERAKNELVSCGNVRTKMLERIFPELAESEQKPNGGIVREDFTQGDGWYKVNLDYLSKAQVEEIEQLVEKWNPKEVSEDKKIKKAILIYLDWLDGKKDYLPKGDYTIKDMILWLEKQGEKHPDPYNGISFEYNGHIWGMCARDNGVDISCDKHLIKHLERQGEQKFEMKTAEESLGISSDEYNKIVDECLFGEQKLTEFERGLFDMLTDISKPCTADCVKSHSEKLLSIARKMIALEQNLTENAKPQSSTPMSYGKELEKRMCEACNRFFAPNTDSNRYSASDLFYAGVKAERDLNTLAWSEEDEPKKELAASYLAKFDEKFPILPTLKGKQLADYKNFLNKCQQIFGLRYWGIRPIQAKLFEKLSLLWAAWGAEHLQGLGQTDGDMDNEISMWSEEDEAFLDDILCKLEHDLILNKDEKDWLKSLRLQNQWKPSDEQIAQLQIVVDTYGNEGIYDPILTELLFQLKKIKGEV